MKIRGIDVCNDVVSYLETALWSSTISISEEFPVTDYAGFADHPEWADMEDCDPFDDWFDIHDFSEDAVKEAVADWNDFIEYLESIEYTDGDDTVTLYDRLAGCDGADNAGHDFWLNRNGHGAGFWDGDYDDSDDYPDLPRLGDELDAACKTMTCEGIDFDDNGQVYFL